MSIPLIHGRGPDVDHIPGSYGWPVIGDSLRFARDAERWTLRRMEQFGRVFKGNILFEKAVLFADPDAARTVLLDRENTFSSEGGWDNFIGKLFARGLMLRDFDDHRFHRRIMQDAFRSEAMSGYMDLMNPVIERRIASWEGRDRIDFYAETKQLTLDIAAAVFVGESFGERAAEVNRAFMDAVDASITPVRWEVPGSAFRRGMQGRRFLEEYFRSRIPERRAADGTDLFSRLCHSVDEDGNRFVDDDIVDHMIFLLLAAHDTTTGTLATMAWETARNPNWQERIRAEMARLPGPALTWEDRDALDETEWVFREAMRLHPPVPFMPRRVLAETELAGYRIPAGTLVSVSSLLIHRLAEYWTAPHEFDPLRFSPDRAEHRTHSHVFIPFGGGAHTCIGRHFAGLMAKAILVQAFRRYRLVAAPGQQVQIKTVPIPKPRGGLPLRLERIR